MDYVTQLPESFDSKRLLEEFEGLGQQDQLYVTSHNGKTYDYPHGVDFVMNYNERDLVVVNSIFSGSYTEKVFHEVDKKYDVCRARFMTLGPPPLARAYSYHKDLTPRLHIPLTTNDDCMFLVNDELRYMPELGTLYFLDTTQRHTALNLGWTKRTHLVFCVK